jgi:regulator of sigma E protease
VIDFLYYAAAFIVALGILIVVHEFGHFWVAQRLGVKVLRFSVGFGKPLWSRRVGRDRMELVVAALPLGGYVKMLDENEGKVQKKELRRAFNRQPVWKRMAIVSAGPLFNFLFAILAYWLIFMVGVDGLKPIVGKVIESSIAHQAGFRAGDEILRIDEKPVLSWNHRRLYLFQRALDRDRVTVEVRDDQGQIQTRVLDLTDFPVANVNATLVERGIGLYGYFPEILPIIGNVEPGPAANAGLQAGDRIVSINDQPMQTWQQMAMHIQDNPGRQLVLIIMRDGAREAIQVTPESVEQNGKRIGRLFIRPQLPEIPEELKVKLRFGPMQALVEGASNTWSMGLLTLEMLYRMLRLEVSTKNISGPITIAQYAGHSAKIGINQFVVFLAIISISLGVLNLLPIPILDGGHLLYYVIEVLTGRPVSERVLAWGQQIGVMILVGLMLLAFYNDLTRIFQ